MNNKSSLERFESISNQKKIQLSTVLPEGLNKALIGRVSEFSQLLGSWADLLELSINALTAFMQKRFSAFDAIVGDNRCEIRALYVMRLYQEIDQENLKKVLQRLLGAQVRLSSDLSLERSFGFKGVTFCDLLHKYDLELPDELFWLIVLYGLTLVKQKGQNHIDITNHRALSEACSGISVGLAKRLVARWQNMISLKSMRFIREEACKIQGVERRLSTYLDDENVYKDSHGRVSLPISIVLRVILDRVFSDPTAIVVLKINLIESQSLVGQKLLFFCRDKTSVTSYSEDFQNFSSSEDSPMFVVEGCSMQNNHEIDAMKTLSHTDIRHVILANGANKPEYPSKMNRKKTFNVRSEDRDIIEDIMDFRAWAGFSLKDPSVLCISHISAQSFKEVIESVWNHEANLLPSENEALVLLNE